MKIISLCHKNRSANVGMMDLNDFTDSGSITDASSLKYEESSRRPSKYDVNPFEVNRF
jgi:hypothetical protein